MLDYSNYLKILTIEKYREAKEMFKSAGRDLFESDVNPENRFILEKYSAVEAEYQ